MSLVAVPTASYDPAATVVRLCYDLDPGANGVDDPAIIHELAHYGQNIGTALGIDQTLMWHELFVAAAHILMNDGAVELPLFRSQRLPQLKDQWARADLARTFLDTTIGTSSADGLRELGQALPQLRDSIVGGALTAGAPNPFFINFRAPGPGFGVRGAKHTELFFRLNGHFIQEIHAHASAFLSRWSHERLSLDDAVEAFLGEHARPETLFYFMVQKLITERLGRGVFDVQDSVGVCQLSCHLALNGMCVPLGAWRGGICAIEGGGLEFYYRDPGHVFLAVLSSCLDQFVEPGWGIHRYFDLLGATLVALGWPPFDEMMEHLKRDVVGRCISSLPRGDSDGYSAYILAKLRDSETLLDRLVSCTRRRDIMGFVQAPLELIMMNRVSGPVLMGPGQYHRLSGTGELCPSAIRIGGLITGFLIRKLWYGSDLTCLDLPGEPHSGSVIRCARAPECTGRADMFQGVESCANPSWRRCLSRIPGLAARVREAG